MDEVVRMNVTKRRKVSDELLVFGVKGKLLEIVEKNLDHRSAVELKRRLNRRRTEKERGEIEYFVVED